MRGNIIKKRLISFKFEKTSRISLNCRLVPVQYREYEYGLESGRLHVGRSFSTLGMVDSKGFPAKIFISIENNRQEVFASPLRILIIKSLLWNPDSSNLERRRAFWIERSVLNNSKENDFFVRVFESEGLGNQDSAVKWRPWSDLKQRRFWDTDGSRKLTFLFPGACYSFPTD